MARGLDFEPRRAESPRTEADKYRTGYVLNPNNGIAGSELPKIREVPARMARSEVLYQRGLVREIFAGVKHTLSLSKISL